MAETPRFAHFVALLFLGTAFVTLVCFIIALVAAVAKAWRVAKIAAACTVLFPVAYVTLLFAVSFASTNKTLQAGSWKYFCEADCHIAYSIDGVQFVSTLGSEAKPITAQGQFVVVRLKTWFDEHSIAPWRGNSPLTPNPRTVRLLDDSGRTYFPLPDAAEAIPAASTPLSQSLRPGDSYTTTFVFDLPVAAHNPKLLIADSDPVSCLLVDHENSPLHGKIYLALYGGATSARLTNAETE